MPKQFAHSHTHLCYKVIKCDHQLTGVPTLFLIILLPGFCVVLRLLALLTCKEQRNVCQYIQMKDLKSYMVSYVVLIDDQQLKQCKSTLSSVAVTFVAHGKALPPGLIKP